MLVYPEKKRIDNSEEYFAKYSLYREPFSIATDPDFFFQTRQHFGTLQQLQMSVKLNRGLCLIAGVAGTGKTALCMRLKKRLELNENNLIHIITARHYESSLEFLTKVARKILGPMYIGGDETHLKKQIETQLKADTAFSDKKTVLLIDDAHKLPYWCFDILKELLAIEIQGKKLLQVIIFGQTEINDLISEKTSLGDMICLYRELEPLNFRDTMQMIRFRLRMASRSPNPVRFFSWPGILAIYLASGGYPRRIVNLCHRCVVAKLPRNNTKAGWYFVKECSKKVFTSRNTSPFNLTVLIPWIVIAIIGITFISKYADKKIAPLFTSVVSVFDKYSGFLTAKNEPVALNSKTDDFLKEQPFKADVVASSDMVLPPVVSNETLVQEEISDDVLPVSVAIEETLPEEVFPEKLEVPAIIGSVQVQRGDSFLIMVERVYGHSRGKFSVKVKEANGQLKNISSLDIGDTLYFPSIKFNPVPPDGSGGNYWWIKTDSADSLGDAVNKLKQFRKKGVPVSLVSFHNAYSGMRFFIVLKTLFTEKTVAEQALASYSDNLSTSPEIIQFTFANTDYFANPYFNGY